MDDINKVRECEENLRVAMLAGDVKSLSSLIDNQLVFTGPDGTVMTKEQDLACHESGLLKLIKIDLTDTSLHRIADMVLVTTRASLAGSFDGAPIDGAFAYTRLWSQSSGRWRVIAGHAGVVG